MLRTLGSPENNGYGRTRGEEIMAFPGTTTGGELLNYSNGGLVFIFLFALSTALSYTFKHRHLELEEASFPPEILKDFVLS